MSRMNRRSKRQHQKDKRRAQRRKNRRHGQKAGSIAINSLLPGLEGAELGSMDVVVDERREDEHPALINVVVHDRAQERAVIWSIETGFGGLPSRVGYQIAPDGPVDELPETTWLPAIDEAGDGGQVDDVVDVGASQADDGAETAGEALPPGTDEVEVEADRSEQ